MSKKIRPKLSDSSQIVELIPWGLAPAVDGSRPLILFREKEGEMILPVWVSHLDAGIAVTQSHTATQGSSPHDLTKGILKKLGVTVKSCEFVKVKGHHQYAKLKFAGSEKLEDLEVRADHVVSFCLHSKSKFFAKKSVILKSRDVEQEMKVVSQGAAHVPDLIRNPHPYLN